MTPSREIALFLLALSVVVGSSPVPTLQDYTHNVVLDGNENYHVYWKFDDEKITFEVHVRTTGWVGFGFSPNGGMPGSDMVVGWVLDNGEVKFTDRHATAYHEPIVDDKHDYKLLLGKEEDDFTVLKFERLIDTCDDEHDWLITSDTTRVIWAHHHDDPDDGVPMLRHSHRGTKSVRLLSVVGENESDLGPDVMTYDLLNNNFHLPATDTTYYCLGYKLPELDSKHHIIKYEPVIQAGNEAHVHHILVYQCRSDFNETQYHQTGHICYTANMPDDWYYCSSTVIAWAVGGAAFYFPEHAGLSLGADGDPTFVMLEMHYDNPDSLDNIYDSSGIRIYYTPRLREYDASVLNLGQDVSSRQIIPPGAEDYRNYGYCLGGITQEGFVNRVTGEATDVKVFAVGLHTHLLGKAVGVTHVRDGKELRVLAKDDHYDFNFQEFSMLPEEVVLKPGDDIITECVYDSTGRSSVTYGGESTAEEMCLSFLFVYPSILMDWCVTWTELNETAAVVGIEELNTLVWPPKVISPPQWENMTVAEVLDATEWNEEKIAQLQHANKQGYQGSVGFGGTTSNPMQAQLFHNSIEITEALPPAQRECDVIEPTTAASAAVFPSSIMVALVTVAALFR